MNELASLNDATSASIRFVTGDCSLGCVLLAMSPVGACAILLGDEAEVLISDLGRRFSQEKRELSEDAECAGGLRRVVELIEAPALGPALPLDIRGTAFQLRVWRVLREIPPGGRASYAEVARRIGAPNAARAVAGACAANPLAVAIPCHRVVRSDGALSGYRWGIARKAELLRRES